MTKLTPAGSCEQTQRKNREQNTLEKEEEEERA
jgi:hypothetical protein